MAYRAKLQFLGVETIYHCDIYMMCHVGDSTLQVKDPLYDTRVYQIPHPKWRVILTTPPTCCFDENDLKEITAKIPDYPWENVTTEELLKGEFCRVQ